MAKLFWKTEKRKVNDLKLFEGNPRQMTKKQAADLLDSLKKFNLVEIPAINQDNEVIAGNMRVQALKKLGRENEEIEVRIPSRPLTKEESREYLLRSNKNTGEWDWGMLANFDEGTLKDVGFSSEELDKAFSLEIKEDDFDVQTEYEKIVGPQAKYGDIFKLGEHRLECGDSKKREDVEKLMAGALADMIFTDPPYNIGWDHDDRSRNRFNSKYKISKVFSKGVFKDNWTTEDFVNFLTNVFQNAFDFTKDKMGIYVCYGGKYQSWTIEGLERAGFHYSQNIIWVKERMVPVPGQLYHHLYEGIAFGWKRNQGKDRILKYNFEDVFALKFDKFKDYIEGLIDVWWEKRDILSQYQHPTQKPVRLSERAIKVSSERDEIVLDLFNGSGSTMLACEQLGRKCYAMELDPKYVDVAIKRWEDFTGKKAEKITD